MAKLRLSFETYSLPTIELDPNTVPMCPSLRCRKTTSDWPSQSSWRIPALRNWVLQFNASSDRPAKIGGKWNPLVKEDLEARLRKGHVKLTEAFHWTLRGARTLIEKKRVPEIVQKAEWARYPVRDGKMEIIDAINYVSFVRSKGQLTRQTNVSFGFFRSTTSRMLNFFRAGLLLEKMGYWRYWGNQDEPTLK